MWVGVVRRMADHPRSRGVYDRHPRPVGAEFGSSPLARGLLRQANGQQEITGSSPLARGLHGVAAADLVHDGIIPARAGFTRIGGRLFQRGKDHPRSRGVYLLPGGLDGDAQGSSPLARGLRKPPGEPFQSVRIIPARAGFTGGGGGGGGGDADHPRSRGVYSIMAIPKGVINGSSPLARGLQAGEKSKSIKYGIIPARAGFTSGRLSILL